MVDASVARSPGRLRASKNRKFTNPDFTVAGERRARVPFRKLETLWINTGTLCNIECVNCYIESSPSNDRLAYITASEVRDYLDEIDALRLGTREIAFTGGEPFMNPDMLEMARDALSRGHEALILTNAMQPMQRKRSKAGLLELRAEFGKRLSLRVSLDHHTQALHETERGPRTWAMVLAGLDWLSGQGFRISIAGRTCWGEEEKEARKGYAALIARHGWPVSAFDPFDLLLFPEMDEAIDVPEITSACWDLLGVSPDDVMCAISRMVVKRRGAAKATVVPCTLLPYARAFEMGSSLEQASRVHGGMFDHGAVKLCHPHCARFCVFGGGKCST